MKCTNCKNNIDMAQIPYIEHEYRMTLAHIREKRLIWGLIISNVVWALLFALKVGGII